MYVSFEIESRCNLYTSSAMNLFSIFIGKAGSVPLPSLRIREMKIKSFAITFLLMDVKV